MLPSPVAPMPEGPMSSVDEQVGGFHSGATAWCCSSMREMVSVGTHVERNCWVY